MLWDLLQQLQISRSDRHAMDADERIDQLERQLERTNEVLIKLIRYIEKRDRRDLDGDGLIG